MKKWPRPPPCLLGDVSQAFLEAVAEEKPHVKPYFSKTIRDLEVVEGSAARFDCKIEGKLSLFLPLLQKACAWLLGPSCVPWATGRLWAALEQLGAARLWG